MLVEQLTPLTTVLTPNRRLSASLLKRHAASQIAQGKMSWPTLSVLPISSWLEKLMRSMMASEFQTEFSLLTGKQEQILWEEVLRETTDKTGLLQIASTAELARSAYKTLKQWQVDIHHPDMNATEDSVIFQKWAERFESLCAEKKWLSTDHLATLLLHKIQQGLVILPTEIELYGFTEHTPMEQHFFAVCESLGCQITHASSSTHNESISRIALMDEDTEIENMARWAKNLWDENPDAFIGCVFPRLEQMRERVLQIFSRVFSAKETLILDHTELPFNISAGRSLAVYPVIHTALQLLQMNPDKIPLERVSDLLRSPFIGEAEKEMTKRALLENILRSDNKTTIKMSVLIESANQCPALAKRLQAYLDKRQEMMNKALPVSEWVEVFVQMLELMGWPGERTLDSPEYQVVKDWYDLLHEYTQFDAVLKSKTYAKALDYLIELTTREIFQPESPETKIQLLGMLEAAEMPFDYLWVMGLDDSAWPPFPKPNPFIPQRLQKKLNMPHATAERELLYCEELTAQLMRGAKNVIFSHAIKNDDAELRPSPLIVAIKELAPDQLQLSPFVAPSHYIYESRAIDYLNDEVAPAVLNPDTLRGGASIFKLQAACPFKAFAEIRLGARHIDAPTLGLRAKDRGNILHKALEFIWNDLRDQDALLALTPEALDELVDRCVRLAIDLNSAELKQNKRYLELECKRLSQLLLEWLGQEKRRPHFKIASLEKTFKTTFCQIPLTMRADRIDELDNGKMVIMDYKSSKMISVNDWFGDRPDEPQLPLYCVTDPTNTIGILFAQINPEKMELKGVSGVDMEMKSVKTLSDIPENNEGCWSEQVKEWETTLTALGNQFFQGDARVDPKNIVETCRFCHLQSLCRVNEVITEPA